MTIDQKSDIFNNGEKYMMTNEDLKRVKNDPKKHRLENLAKACANAKSDEMKSMWYNKMMKLADEYNMRDWVMRTLVH